MKQILIAILVVFGGFVALPVQAAGGKVITEVLSKWGDDILEAGAKVSGRTLPKTEKLALGKLLTKYAAKYGDDAMEQIVRRGGLEVLEQGAKHGDDFLRLCKAVPEASRALAMHTDDLLPIAKRIGPDFLKLECKAPGLAKRIVEQFGDDAAKVVLNKSPQYSGMLLKYAEKADSPATQKLFYECYKNSKAPQKFFEALSWKHIMAGGLSTAAVIAAYKVSDGVEDGLREGLSNPEVAKEVVKEVANKSSYLVAALVVIAFLMCPFASKQLRKSIAVWRKPPTTTTATATTQNPNEPPQA
jgi:hypothetical protein